MSTLFHIPWLLPAGLAGVAVLAVIIYHLTVTNRLRAQLAQTEQDAEEQAKRLETERRELQVAAREESLKLRSQIEEELHRERADLEKVRRRLDERDDNLDKRKADLERQSQDLQRREKDLAAAGDRVTALVAEAELRLQQVAQLTPEQAREQLLARLEEEFRPDLAKRIVTLEEEAREEGERRARKIGSCAAR